MSSDARKKEKKRLKRKQKQQQLRKMKALTPLARIAREGGKLECWATRHYREYGMADVFVLGHAPGGRCAYAAFLVDLFCVGLKDTFGEADVTETEFRDGVLERLLQRSDVVRLDPAEARRLVLGGIRFARQNGFRLPARWDKWASLFGPLGDLARADISDFGKDGKLLYVGDAQFLRHRLIGSTPEQFLRRPDVQWVAAVRDQREFDELFNPQPDDVDYDQEDDEFDEEDEDDESVLDVETMAVLTGLRSVRDRLADAARKWCSATGRQPAPRIQEAMAVILSSMLPSAGKQVEESPTSRQEKAEMIAAQGEQLLRQYPRRVRDEIIESMAQVTEFIKQFKSAEEMYASAGLDPPSEGGNDAAEDAMDEQSQS